MATSSFNITPPNPDLWGTHVTNGIRVGTPAPSQNGFVPGQSNSVLLDNSGSGKLDQYGQGVFTSPIFTYRIRPGQCADPVNSPDIYNGQGTFPAVEDDLALLGPGTQKNAACAKILLNGVSALQFDVPRGLTFILTASPAAAVATTVVYKVYGLDYYLRPKTYLWTINIPANSSGNVPFFFTSTQMFYVITGLRFISSTDTTHVFSWTISSANRFGLPYRLDQVAHMIQYSQTDAIDSTMFTGSSLLSPDAVVYNSETSLNWPQAYNPGDVAAAANNVSANFPNTAIPTTLFSITQVAPPNVGIFVNDGTLAVQCGANYQNPQIITSNDPLGYFTPNTQVEKGTPGGTYHPLDTLKYTGDAFWQGSTLTFTYYVAGADFYTYQMKTMQSWWANYGADTQALANLGYRDYYEKGTGQTYGGNGQGLTALPLEPPAVIGGPVNYINGIPDPNDVRSSKGATPYYETQK